MELCKAGNATEATESNGTPCDKHARSFGSNISQMEGFFFKLFNLWYLFGINYLDKLKWCDDKNGLFGQVCCHGSLQSGLCKGTEIGRRGCWDSMPPDLIVFGKKVKFSH